MPCVSRPTGTPPCRGNSSRRPPSRSTCRATCSRCRWPARRAEHPRPRSAERSCLELGGGAVVVLGVPDAVRPARQQASSARSAPTGRRALRVVGAIGEDIAVLIGLAAVVATWYEFVMLPSRGGCRVVEQRPAVLVEQPRVGRHGAVRRVEVATVAAERGMRRQQRRGGSTTAIVSMLNRSCGVRAGDGDVRFAGRQLTGTVVVCQ